MMKRLKKTKQILGVLASCALAACAVPKDEFDNLPEITTVAQSPNDFLFAFDTVADKIFGYDAKTHQLVDSVNTVQEPHGYVRRPAANQFYVADFTNAKVAQYRFDSSSGRITELTTPASRYLVGQGPRALGIYNQYLFAATYEYNPAGATPNPLPPGKVRSYRINSSGQLTVADGAGVDVGRQPIAMDVHPYSRHIAVASYERDATGKNVFDILSVNQNTGVLTKEQTYQITAIPGQNLRAILFSPNGKYLYVLQQTWFGKGRVYAYQFFDSDGSVSYLGMIEAGYQALGMVIDPASSFLYVANDGNTNTEEIYASVTRASIRLDGKLEDVVEETDLGGGRPSFLAIHPEGGKLAFTNFFDASIGISFMQINAQGDLLPSGSDSPSGITGPWGAFFAKGIAE